MALIDSGSTHNFINEKVANRLLLPAVPTKSFTVKITNGKSLRCQGRFGGIRLCIQGISFTFTLNALLLTSLDIILGVQWLEALGPVACDWKNLTMEIRWLNQNRQSRDLDTPPIRLASHEEADRELAGRHSMYAICLLPRTETTTTDDPELQKLLAEFFKLLCDPNQLPPAREVDHQINLKEGVDLVNVRPYRYIYFQKEEIKKQVIEMLNLGLIRPSINPFSSPILLVRKKMAFGDFTLITAPSIQLS